MIKLNRAMMVLVAGLLLTGGSAMAGDSLLDALKNGKTSIQLQFSLEYSDLEDAADLDAASGLTLRTRLGYRTGEFNGVAFFVQFHNLSQISENYRWPGGGDADHDVIADPHGTRIHQAFVDAKLGQSGMLRLGRQEIILDDARLIGNVGWRQNGQSFDGASFLSIKDRNQFQLAYITRVNTILLTHVDLDSMILLNNRFKATENLNIGAFGYLLDTESDAETARDSATYGLRLDGTAGRFAYDVTFASQSDYADGEGHGGTMINALGKWKVGDWTVGAGANVISGQDGEDRAFDTLFSTAHKYNGWADQFLATNGGNLVNGLQDFYIQAGTLYKGVAFLVVYHLYETTDGNTYVGDYGSELDFQFTRSFNKHVSALLKFAIYSADDALDNPTVDEKVVWARVNIRF